MCVDVPCSMLMLGESMFPSLHFHVRIRKDDETIKHINTSSPSQRSWKKNRRCHGDRQHTNIQKANIFHLVRAPCLHRRIACSALDSLCQNSRDCIACASNQITLHRAISFAASQLNGLFSLLFFFMKRGAFGFMTKTAGFRILFSKHHNNSLSNTGR